MDWREHLNAEQRRAVEHGDGPLLVAAGAGSGKTRTLASRVAHLLESGVPAERILLLTFTRRAAREMLDRAHGLTGDRSAEHVVGGTFHSVANRLLRVHGRAVGLPPGFTVMDQADAADLIGIVRTDLGYGGGDGPRFPRKETLLGIYSRVVNAGVPLGDVLDAAFPWCRDHRDDIARIFDAFTARKRAHAVLDYDDLLLYWRAAATSAGAGPVLRDLFDHVLVDEYQDSNAIQADILASMRPGGRGLTVVGDDAQAIYAFRAASVENMLGFPERFPGTTVVTLERNYRSTPEVLGAANDVIAAARRGYRKALAANRPSGPLPRLVLCSDETAQAGYVADQVLEARERGTALRDQAVLFRTGHHADRLELELGRRDIPYVKYGGLRFLEAAHVKDLLAMLRILDNPFDELAWQRTLGALEGIGPVRARQAIVGLGVTAGPGDGVDPLERFLSGEAPLPGARDEELEALRDALAEAAGSDERQPPPALQVEHLRRVCEVTFPRRYPDAAIRLDDLDQLAEVASAYPVRSRFLTELVLDPPSSISEAAGPPSLDDDYLVLSTIHSAKGGEWDRVHVIHAADGNIPSDMSLGTPEEIEEERRLLYVALTRARDELHVSYPRRFYHRRHGADDAYSTARVSRFLEPVTDRFEQATVGADEADALVAVGATLAADPVESYLAGLW